MELVTQINKIIYRGTKEEILEMYELCFGIHLKAPGFRCNVVETEEWSYLEILIENWTEAI